MPRMKGRGCGLLVGLIMAALVTGACQPEVDAPPVPDVLGQGTLSLYSTDPLTLDPAVSAEMTSHEYIMQIFSGLVRLGSGLEPEPDIAERWEVGDDGRTYTFHLRRDVTFHDGRALTAEDVVYSWERASAPETGSQTAATYLGDIVGVREVLAGEAREIRGVEVVNDYTLRVTIDAPRPYFLYKLAYPTAFVVDRRNVRSGSGWWRKPNGTGPFKLDQWQENQLLVLARHERFYGRVAGVSRVEFLLWAGIPMNLYENGDIDVARVSRPYIDRVTDERGPYHEQLTFTPRISLAYLGFDTSRPPFDDVNVRRAFSLAVDKRKLAALVFRGMVLPAEGILPPGMPGFSEDLRGLEFDVAAALEALRASRYGGASALPSITVTTSGWGGAIGGSLEAIIQEWRENLGVEVTVRQLEPERFLYHLKDEKDEMFYLGWVADYPHPQNFLDVLFRAGADHNYGEYSSPQVDALLDRAGTQPDNAASLELYRRAEELLVEDAACLPLWFDTNYELVKPYVEGYQLNALGVASLNSVSVRDH